MIENLLGAAPGSSKCDIAVIGGGTLGLPTAARLSARGFSVICLESGGWVQKEETHPLNEVVQTRSIYAGAQRGRFRCIGGTSTRWGGALIPFLASDLINGDWPIKPDVLTGYREPVERLFDLPSDNYDAPELMQPLGTARTHLPRLAKWPSFRKRNVFNLLESELRSCSNLRIVLNATVTDFEVVDEHLRAVIARSPDGGALRIEARHFVFAAGAIETTRLLLLLDKQNQNVLSRHGSHLGRNFYDHLSVLVARLQPLDKAALNRLTGFRFTKGGAMRNLRFELAEENGIRTKCVPCFAHIAFHEKQDSGFAFLRDIFRHVQMRRIPPARTIARLILSSPWLVRAIWWRLVEMRLLYPDDADINVHMVIEQTPRPENRISLSSQRTDLFGRPLAQIEWSVDKEDQKNLRAAVDLFEDSWNKSNFAAVAQFERRPPGEAEIELADGGGIYHPGGSTRMAHSPADGVVDPDLRVFGLHNTRVVSTSVLPTGGGANPTMMAIMLAFRCSDDLTRELRTVT